MESVMQESFGNTFQRSAQNMLLGKRTNMLLVRDDVGKSKPTTRKLPAEEHAFGRDPRYVESAQQGKHHFITEKNEDLFVTPYNLV